MTDTPNSYPASFELDAPLAVARWRPLVQWILAIPQFIVMNALHALADAIAFISWFVILFTGRLPVGLANVQAMIQRYVARVFTYAGYLYEDYPPFDFTSSSVDPGGSPVTQSYEPELENRNRLSVAFRFLLVIPGFIVLLVLWIAVWFVWFAAFFAILFTGAWPAGMRRFIERVMRYSTRLGAYVFLLTDRFPPLTLD
jgi:hypothetical protein